jgi:isoamyl acetate esterase
MMRSIKTRLLKTRLLKTKVKQLLTAVGMMSLFSMLQTSLVMASSIPALTDLIAPTTPLRSGDRLVFVGDSITYFGGKPGGYVDLMRRTLAERSDLALQVDHYGLSGARAADLWVGKTHWSESTPYDEILKSKPTILVIYIGVNDIWHEPPTPAEVFQTNLTRLIQQGQETGAIVVVVTPAVIGEDITNHNLKNISLDQFSEIVKQVAIKQNVGICDLRQAFISYLQVHNLANRDRGFLTSDGVHMNAQGNRLIAECVGRSLRSVLMEKRS